MTTNDRMYKYLHTKAENNQLRTRVYHKSFLEIPDISEDLLQLLVVLLDFWGIIIKTSIIHE